ncbi:DUF3298 and DUF4163 domain-containing protein [Robiginitalea sediminis]|uniref:DUF3298 and DUF4163 domain-containing protein n=1 Tax=Robiginitalea sediminis TaxID=1982593 RepID=UPI000B4B1575|nr:DUF3298 and DUF4163 domain-containing protein [Robiginitalea sediminis]
MNRIIWIVLLVLAGRCGDAETIEWQPREYQGPQCEACPSVLIAIPAGPEDDPLAAVVQRSQEEEIIQWLDYDDKNDAASIEEAIDAFGAGYRKLLRDFPDERIGWEAEIESLVRYESSTLLTLAMDGYIFTGGAHGYSSMHLLNFDKVRGRELEAESLLADREGFRRVAEEAFRTTYGISPASDINSTGFMFPENRFELPENMGFSPEGVLLHYNPYEVASYADGPLEVIIPFAVAAPFLVSDYLPEANKS